MSVELERKFQAPVPPSKYFWPRLQPSKNARAPTPQAWLSLRWIFSWLGFGVYLLMKKKFEQRTQLLRTAFDHQRAANFFTSVYVILFSRATCRHCFCGNSIFAQGVDQGCATWCPVPRPLAALDKKICGRAHAISNLSHGDHALIKLLASCMRILSRKMTRQNRILSGEPYS